MEELLAAANPGAHPGSVVVVTGASGFLGRAVCAELVARGAVVYGVSRTSCEAVPGVRSYRVREYGETPTPPGAGCIYLAGASNAQEVGIRLQDERETALYFERTGPR
jgi:NAD(P)-dependent dehydrogenase (short-subunit alcohol dehydrogenase family)